MKTQIIEALATLELDYLDQLAFIQERNRNGEKWGEAGVLLMLSYEKEQIVLLLNKRSSRVQQPGDLCCPGGTLQPSLDRLLRRFLFFQRGVAYRRARDRGRHLFRWISFFLANALRESWEEIRLNPFRVEFLGALPCYQLLSFRRTIFPLVGWVKPGVRLQPNWEVERILYLPLEALFEERNYGLYSLAIPESYQGRIGDGGARAEFPCFVHLEADCQEVLWGATYHIVMSFLKAVFGFQPPAVGSRWVEGELLYPSTSP
ncbi:MAG: CoA pyrophosphatase [Candidatus Tectomicrobia bacterium]|uniref:CoA pyrophosphatase n=1 Tax=Tectimicrobiota bacterium TaxID=2528274 RepID=A0A932CR28_UNCTE|nr:CoA pyrophosphatase [Candidatus Tectomicrobia bacterium]